jgi:hypothetical protein
LAENENEEVALAKTHLRKALDWTRGKAARVGFYGARALNETVEMVARNLKALRLDYAVEDQLERLAAHDRFRAFAEAEHLAPVSITQNNTINVQSTATADDVGDKVSEALINSLKYLSPIPAF